MGLYVYVSFVVIGEGRCVAIKCLLVGLCCESCWMGGGGGEELEKNESNFFSDELKFVLLERNTQ